MGGPDCSFSLSPFIALILLIMSGFVHSHQYSNEHYGTWTWLLRVRLCTDALFPAYVHASKPQRYVFKVATSPYPDTAPSTPEFIDTPSPSSSSHSDESTSTNDSPHKNRIPRPLNCYFIFRKDVVDKKMIPKAPSTIVATSPGSLDSCGRTSRRTKRLATIVVLSRKGRDMRSSTLTTFTNCRDVPRRSKRGTFSVNRRITSIGPRTLLI